MSAKAAFVTGVEEALDPGAVRINDAAIARLRIEGARRGAPREAPPGAVGGGWEAVWLSLALNALNHQFWDVEQGRFERYAHQGEVGALAMKSGLFKWVDEAGSMEALAGGEVGADEIRRWFGAMPNPEDRARALREALGPSGRELAQRAWKRAREGGVWGVELAREVAAELPFGYADPLLKKAQLCWWMAKGMVEERGWGAPRVDLTAFADYQIPKALRGLGVLEYSEELSAMVAAGELLEEGGRWEMAIRNASVAACERVARAHSIESPELDFWLWSRRNEFSERFHLTRTRRY